MRKSINEAISSTVSDMLEIGLETSFTKKELDEMGVLSWAEMPTLQLSIYLKTVDIELERNL